MKSSAAAGTDCAPLVSVKHSSHEMPGTPLSEPVPLGLTSVMDSESWAATTHPSGSGTATPALEAEVGDDTVGCGENDGTGLGEPAGDGLDSSLTSLAAWLLVCAKPTASTVPTPAITSTNTTTTAMIATHG